MFVCRMYQYFSVEVLQPLVTDLITEQSQDMHYALVLIVCIDCLLTLSCYVRETGGRSRRYLIGLM